MVARLSPDGLPEARLGRVGPPPKSLAVRTPMRVCRQSSPAPAGGPPLTWVGFHPGPWFPPGVVGPQAAKQSSPTRCASVPRMEKKSGSGPKRN